MRLATKLHPSRRWVYGFVWCLCFIVIAWGVRVGWHSYSLWAHVNTVTAMSNNINDLDVKRARVELTGIRQAVAALHEDVAGLLPLLPYLGWVPVVGGDLEATPMLLAMTESLLAAADSAAEGWTPLLALLSQRTQNATTTNLELSLGQLSQNRSSFLQAQTYLVQAAKQRNTIKPVYLSAQTRSLLKRVDQGLPLLALAVQGSLDAAYVLGMDAPRSYLVVAQNQDELRPTGGFISGVLRVTVERGKITALAFTDANQIDDLTTYYPDPPSPLLWYMGSEQWLFRDANWSPDFPTTARQLMTFYKQGQHKDVDGVVALDQMFVRLVVGVLGDIQVNGVRVTADNLQDFMHNAWAPGVDQPLSEWFGTRKQFIGELATAMQNRLASSQALDLPAFARAVYSGLNERHLFIYLTSPRVAEAVRDLGWDGALRSVDSDYLMVVDANLGFTKVNRLVQPTVYYDVLISPNLNAQASLTLTYQHQGHGTGNVCKQQTTDYGVGTTYLSLTEGCYWDYVRVYTAQGSQLREASRHPIPAGVMLNNQPTTGEAEVLPIEAGKSVFGNFFMLAWGREQQVHFNYALPQGTLQPQAHGLWQYAFYGQKQGGTTSIPLTLTLTLPLQSQLVYADPPPTIVQTRDQQVQVIYQLQLATDVSLKVNFRR